MAFLFVENQGEKMSSSGLEVSVMSANWEGKVPKNDLLSIQERLMKAPKESVGVLGLLQLKSPVIGLILGLFFGVFGVDRFYKGDIGLGIAKLLLCWITFGIWALVDLFFVWKGIKRDNLNKINAQLALLGV